MYKTCRSLRERFCLVPYLWEYEQPAMTKDVLTACRDPQAHLHVCRTGTKSSQTAIAGDRPVS